jgi:multidrug resistance efflux pump
MKLKLFTLFLISLVLTACASKVTSTPEPTRTEQQANSAPIGSDSAAASGVVVAAEDAQMAFALSGSLKSINVAVGDKVQPGQVLAELESNLIQMDYAQAERTIKELTSPAAQAAAAMDLAVAQQALKDQQERVDSQFYRRASDTLIDNTQGEIDLAKQALARASDAYKMVARKQDGDSQKAAALVAMTSAQLRLNDLIARLNWYSGKPSEIDAALAQAKLDAAKAAVQEAEWYLTLLKGEQIPSEATGSNLTRLEMAKNTLATIKDKLDHIRLVSPIAGTVIDVNAISGESVLPGQILFSISNVSSLHVETTDLSERDVPKVSIGQAVMVSVKALNLTVPGHVVRISPVADLLGGDVVYKTVIDLDEVPEGLLAGMSVDVIYQAGQ